MHIVPWTRSLKQPWLRSWVMWPWYSLSFFRKGREPCIEHLGGQCDLGLWVRRGTRSRGGRSGSFSAPEQRDPHLHVVRDGFVMNNPRCGFDGAATSAPGCRSSACIFAARTSYNVHRTVPHNQTPSALTFALSAPMIFPSVPLHSDTVTFQSASAVSRRVAVSFVLPLPLRRTRAPTLSSTFSENAAATS